MRTIKFRVFVKEEKIIKPIIGIMYMGNSVLAGKISDFKIYNWNEIELLQSTGFYDKNGKEIYEGDILKSSYKDYMYWVIFENGGFYIHNAEKKPAYLSTRYGSIERAFEVFKEINAEIEIIGNIHENPELLKK